MSRIVYLAFPTGDVSGGQKMIVRHVETLRELGFDAVCWQPGGAPAMPWLSHAAQVETGTAFQADDVLVVPSDAANAIARAAQLPQQTVIFCQNHFSLFTQGLEAIDRFPADRFPTFISVGRITAAAIGRLYPSARVEFVPCFADERIFRPQPKAQPAIAYVPRKRPMEVRGIRNVFRRLHPRHADIPWVALQNASEEEVARVFGASTLFLSLSRFEAIGMTPLEAMACDCVCAGFTGLGGLEFATPANGFWAGEDDLEGAADALARAADLAAADTPALRRHLEAGRETAARWSYAAFRMKLEEVWSRLAPSARVGG